MGCWGRSYRRWQKKWREWRRYECTPVSYCWPSSLFLPDYDNVIRGSTLKCWNGDRIRIGIMNDHVCISVCARVIMSLGFLFCYVDDYVSGISILLCGDWRVKIMTD